MSEDSIREEFGDVSLESAPVNPDNPTFDSLLGALQAVHTGKMDMEVLRKYHAGLSTQLSDARSSISAMEDPPEDFPADLRTRIMDQKRLSLGSLDITKTLLDALSVYIATPNPDNLRDVVTRHLEAQRISRDVHLMLEENSRFAGD